MSELDTKYVDEALNYKTKMKKPIWIKWGIMAACLCLIICVVTIPRLLNGSNPPISGDLAPMVYVNNKLYQYTDSQLDFTDKVIGVIMLIVAFVFIMFALNHPEKSFPWNNTITWLLYGVYFLVTVVLLIAPKMKK